MLPIPGGTGDPPVRLATCPPAQNSRETKISRIPPKYTGQIGSKSREWYGHILPREIPETEEVSPSPGGEGRDEGEQSPSAIGANFGFNWMNFVLP